MDLESIGAALRERKAELSEELGRLTAAPRDPMTAVSFGKRIGDGTTEAVERLNKVATAEVLSAKAAEVDRALAKIDEGTYGECDICGHAIGAERLEAVPWTALCLTCAASR